MITYLFDLLQTSGLPGSGLFKFISFRAAMSLIFSLFISIVLGKHIIRKLQRLQIGETVRDLGLQGQMSKQGTPTMGGIIILAAIIIPTLLFAKLGNVYIQLMLFTTVWLGALGFADDYIKVFRKNKEGLPGKLKILGQIILGLVVGLTMYLSPDIMIVENVRSDVILGCADVEMTDAGYAQKSTKTTIPFVKNNEFDYAALVSFMGSHAQLAGWIVFILAVIFITAAVSNGANLTDGLDGLAAGTSGIIAIALAIFAYLSGNIIYADYLNIMYIPFSGEMVVFGSAFLGAVLGFWWYNSYPAQVFMGDTGSLALGGIIAVFAILVRKELLIPVLCGVFLAESLSVIMQVSYFKYTKQKTGIGKRIFLMSPLHHHFQKKGMPEPKIVSRFYIVGILLAVITIVTLKVR
jgi:phospho-N-acetylmuramoyl-pentapeptide-transferase